MAYAPTTIRPQLPQYYGERMPDGTTIESPRARTVEADESREASLRLPIQPNDVRLQPGVKPPASPIAPADTFRFGLETQRIRPKRARQSLRGDISNWASIPLTEQTGESHRNPGPTSTEYRGSGAYQMPYAEESSYSDEEKPKPLRMPSRRHSRPPLSYRRVSNATTRYRPSHDQVRGSVDGSRRTDFEGYESDSRDRLHHQQFYESDDEPPYESRATHVGGGHRGPPKPPPATGQVLRLPWTMWMNSNAKNRMYPP
jgi:aquaporin related protein